MATVAECARVLSDVPRAPVAIGRWRPCWRSCCRVAHALSSPASVVKPHTRLAQLAVAVGVRWALAGRAGSRRRRHRGREMIRIPVCVVVGDSVRQHGWQRRWAYRTHTQTDSREQRGLRILNMAIRTDIANSQQFRSCIPVSTWEAESRQRPRTILRSTWCR